MEDLQPFPDPSADTTAFSIELQLLFDGQPYELFQEVENVTGYGQVIERVMLYLAQIHATKTNGEELQLSELEFFDVGNGLISVTLPIDTGEYSGLRFDVGVPVELNGTNDPDFEPTLYGPDHPLSLSNNMYWGWSAGYRFMIYEGRVDTTPGAIDPSDLPVTYSIHMGKDTTYLPLQFDLPFTVIDSVTTNVLMEIDLSACMHNSSDTLYLDDPDDNVFHGGNIPLAMRFREMLTDAIQLSVQ